MKKNFCCRHFSCAMFRERRLIGFGVAGESGPMSWKDDCDRSSGDPPAAGEVTAAPGGKRVPPLRKPRFDDIHFDMRPDEPSHLLGDSGKVEENRSDEIRKMNRSQFKRHLKRVFESSMKGGMGLEHERQHRLARGRRYAEARRRMPNTRQGRKDRLAFVASHADDIYEDAEQEFQKMQKSPEQLFGADQYAGMLEQITNDIWSSDEFQRGNVNYLQAYQKAWVLYTNMAMQQSYDNDGIHEHPLFTSGPFTQKRAPGTYHGELTQERAAFTSYRPTSYAQAKIREHAGTMDAADQELLNSLPVEARRIPDADLKKYPYKIDAKYRDPVISTLNKELDLHLLRADDLAEKVTIEEYETAKKVDGMPQLLGFKVNDTIVRLDPKDKGRAGLVIVDPTHISKENEPPEVYLLEYENIASIRESFLSDPYLIPLIGTAVATGKEWDVFDALDDLHTLSGQSLREPATYIQLLDDCLTRSVSNYALDEVRTITQTGAVLRPMVEAMRGVAEDPAKFNEMFAVVPPSDGKKALESFIVRDIRASESHKKLWTILFQKYNSQTELEALVTIEAILAATIV